METQKQTTLNLYFGQKAIIRDEQSEVDIIDSNGNKVILSTGDIFDINEKLIKR